MYSLPVRRLRLILKHVAPDSTLSLVEEMESAQLPRLYNLTMADGTKLLLSFAPSLAVRLLRQEATLISSEAILVYFIAGSDRRLLSEASANKLTEPLKTSVLQGLIPKLLKHSSNNKEMAYPYSIYEPVVGTTLSTVSTHLSIPERRAIDKQVGFAARALASLTSPSGTFGTVSQVIQDPFSARSSTSPGAQASNTWSEGFNTLLEAILRDGEDMAVLLPYEVIRAHFRRLSWHLNVITLPRLMILDMGSETNVLVERGSDGGISTSPTGVIKLTGLRTWAQGVFGDPLLADSFDDPSEGFMEGWRDGGEQVIEHEDNAVVRLLLYRCYRAVVTIVTEYYRPKGDSSRRELAGRRKLTSVLAELERVDIEVGEALKRARDFPEEAANSKRQKVEGEDF